MSGRPPTKSTTGQSKNNKNQPKAGLSTSAQTNKSSTGAKGPAPNSQQKVNSQLSFGIDIIDNILNRGSAQTTNTPNTSNPSAPTTIPHTPLSQDHTNGFETTQSVDLSRFQREDSTRFLSVQDLTSSPQLVSTMQGLYTSQQTINKTNTLATSQIDPSFSILDRLVQSGFFDAHSS